jgi:hypothetical protein
MRCSSGGMNLSFVDPHSGRLMMRTSTRRRSLSRRTATVIEGAQSSQSQNSSRRANCGLNRPRTLCGNSMTNSFPRPGWCDARLQKGFTHLLTINSSYLASKQRRWFSSTHRTKVTELNLKNLAATCLIQVFRIETLFPTCRAKFSYLPYSPQFRRKCSTRCRFAPKPHVV